MKSIDNLFDHAEDLDLDKIHQMESDMITILYDIYNELFSLYFHRRIIDADRVEILNQIYNASEAIEELRTKPVYYKSESDSE